MSSTIFLYVVETTGPVRIPILICPKIALSECYSVHNNNSIFQKIKYNQLWQ